MLFSKTRDFIKNSSSRRKGVTLQEYFERGSTSEQKVDVGCQTFAGDFCEVNGEFSNL